MARRGVSRRRFLRNAALASVALSHRKSLRAWAEDAPEANLAEHRIFYEQPAASWPDALPAPPITPWVVTPAALPLTVMVPRA